MSEFNKREFIEVKHVFSEQEMNELRLTQELAMVCATALAKKELLVYQLGAQVNSVLAQIKLSNPEPSRQRFNRIDGKRKRNCKT